jgi:hypothetical protein
MTFVLFARRINGEKDGAISGNTVSLEIKKAAKGLPFSKLVTAYQAAGCFSAFLPYF